MCSFSGKTPLTLLFLVVFPDLLTFLRRLGRLFFFRLIALTAAGASLFVLDGGLRFFRTLLRFFVITTLCRNGLGQIEKSRK